MFGSHSASIALPASAVSPVEFRHGRAETKTGRMELVRCRTYGNPARFPPLLGKEPVTIILPTLAVAFAAFCVWLIVRIVNRRERWAKWTLAATLAVPVLYVASFGPASWLSSRANLGCEIVALVLKEA